MLTAQRHPLVISCLSYAVGFCPPKCWTPITRREEKREEDEPVRQKSYYRTLHRSACRWGYVVLKSFIAYLVNRSLTYTILPIRLVTFHRVCFTTPGLELTLIRATKAEDIKLEILPDHTRRYMHCNHQQHLKPWAQRLGTHRAASHLAPIPYLLLMKYIYAWVYRMAFNCIS